MKLRNKIGKLYESWVAKDATEEEDSFQEEFSGNTGDDVDAMAFYTGYLLGVGNDSKQETVEEVLWEELYDYFQLEEDRRGISEEQSKPKWELYKKDILWKASDNGKPEIEGEKNDNN
jgi:hypothetical protein